jgi:6-phosphogluconolactonase
MTIQLEVVETPARTCAAILIGAAASSGNVVLAGGSTPRAAYQELVQAVRTVGLDLTNTTFWFGDERCVPPEDKRSNYLMVRQALLDRLDGSNQPRIHRVQGELGSTAAAEAYERELLDAGPPEFDLVLLGMGPDGHTASLFPDQPTLSERSRLVAPVQEPGLEPFVPRVTFTLPALASAREIVFLITGDSKAGAVAAAFGPEAKPDPHVPSSLLVPLANEITVLLDPAAAGKL